MCTAIKQMVNKGKFDGISEANDRYSRLLTILLKTNRLQDIERITQDHDFREALYQQFGII